MKLSTSGPVVAPKFIEQHRHLLARDLQDFGDEVRDPGGKAPLDVDATLRGQLDGDDGHVFPGLDCLLTILPCSPKLSIRYPFST